MSTASGRACHDQPIRSTNLNRQIAGNMLNMIQRIEDAKKVEIGRMFDVPHVKWMGNFQNSVKPYWVPSSLLIPILGPLHEDREIIGFPYNHWHIDWRFVPVMQWIAIKKRSLHRERNTSAASKVLSDYNTDGVIVRKKRKCLRSHITFPDIGPWHVEIEEAYHGSVMKCRVCPHRGISLVGAPVVNGAIICPGHGLAWDPETGKLKPRKLKPIVERI